LVRLTSLLERLRADVTAPLQEPRAKAILLDIEGTTTPTEFVYQVLFPYARQQVIDFLQQHREAPEACADVDALRKEHALDLARGARPPDWRDYSADALLGSVVAYVHWLMDRDRKSTALKSLQGKIWEQGYRTGELHSEVYPDVPRAFSRWHSEKKGICIFSSGSVLAQKLLFAHTTAGDLTHFIKEYFDTTTGKKIEAESYGRISNSLGLSLREILFVSDTVAELNAANLAGMKTILCTRPGRERPRTSSHPTIETFDELSA
jgi:enolase-phosphatase E1